MQSERISGKDNNNIAEEDAFHLKIDETEKNYKFIYNDTINTVNENKHKLFFKDKKKDSKSNTLNFIKQH